MGIRALVAAIYNLLFNQGGSFTGGVYPDLAAGVTLTGGKSWAYGAYGQFVAAASNTSNKWVTAVNLSSVVVADKYQGVLATGGAGSESDATGTTFLAGISETTAAGEVPDQNWGFTNPWFVASGSRIAGKVANAAAGAANTVVAKIAYRSGLF